MAPDRLTTRDAARTLLDGMHRHWRWPAEAQREHADLLAMMAAAVAGDADAAAEVIALLQRRMERLCAGANEVQRIACRLRLRLAADGWSGLAGVPHHLLFVAGSSDVRMLLGTARGWSTAQASLPALTMARQDAANPGFVVNEIYKAVEHGHHGSWTQALLVYLEPESARGILDEFLGVEVDYATSLGSSPPTTFIGCRCRCGRG